MKTNAGSGKAQSLKKLKVYDKEVVVGWGCMLNFIGGQ